MLCNVPHMRWTVGQLKKHRYFSGLDWSMLERGEYGGEWLRVRYSIRCGFGLMHDSQR